MRATILFAGLLLASAVSAEEFGPTNIYSGEGVEVNMLSDYEAGTRFAESGNQEMATTMFRQGAEKGDPRAMFALGTQYYFGEGAAQDFAEARKWFETAIAEGDGPSAFVLSMMYARGEGVAADPAKSLDLLRTSAGRCVAHAQIELARRLFEGDGVESDTIAAAAWLDLAAEEEGDVGAEAAEGRDVLMGRLDEDGRRQMPRVAAGLRAQLSCPQ